ncbi:hypothetical protein COT97_04705 [Candidatus Falkowbacteria bacterium CG10_big_fil_rev_8_21_14_0_10_39_11]|uniref:Uncharacterized protein n=1 Tax=Candidatus Falkowbacteria bacterium CG10_big_fil_rev_8_21_14_0_10_39_11 TaxID=1974565 RepID=A0A2H0V438_9BACT|nr:MAG: hypothetical protein COT97_04705 [Candidatus Falkowbacteria bacterium CG10_big_fil_rev_8_21_14_0_10_39_11]
MSLVQVRQALPAIPVALPSIHGENIDLQALQLSGKPYETAEAIIIRYRNMFSPEKCRWFRRYYIKPHRGSFAQNRYSVRYVWNMNNAKADRTIGVIVGEDVAAAQILIGNESAGRSMTGIRWELCEDRDGEEPIAIGRFDPWSLLQDISAADLQRLKDTKDLVPDVTHWDFDSMLLNQNCQSCHRPVTINYLVYNIDSVRCAHCGTRPFMSRSLEQYWRARLQAVNTSDGHTYHPEEILAHSIAWMAGVGSKPSELMCNSLPAGLKSADQVLQNLLKASKVSNLDTPRTTSPGLTLSAVSKLQKLSGGMIIEKSVRSAASALQQQIASGQPFTKVHTAMAEMLRAVSEAI